MKALRLPLCLIAISTLASCSILTPKTRDLERVHQTYTNEWIEASMPKAGAQPGVKVQPGAFKRSLAAIRNYKVEHGKNTTVASHLTVLEGLIHLQSGSFGMARLLSADVAEAKGRLRSRGGWATRDYLIASCYPDLVAGWSAAARMGRGDQSVRREDFEGPAVRIGETLAKLEDGAADADVDSGGAYVATSAVIFWMWAREFVAENGERAAIVGQARKLLEPWLSDSERASVESGTHKESGMNWGSRERFLDWYAFLINGG